MSGLTELMTMIDDVKENLQSEDYNNIVKKIQELKVEEERNDNNLYDFVYFTQKNREVILDLSADNTEDQWTNRIIVKKKWERIKINNDTRFSIEEIIEKIENGDINALSFHFVIPKSCKQFVKILDICNYAISGTYIRPINRIDCEALVEYRNIIPISLKQV